MWPQTKNLHPKTYIRSRARALLQFKFCLLKKMSSVRVAVIELFEDRQFESSRLLHVHIQTVYKAIDRYRTTGSNDDRPRSGRPRTARTKETMRKVKVQIMRNPRRSSKKLAASMRISKSSVRKILKNDLGLKPYKLHKAHNLTDPMKAVRVSRCKSLLRRFANGAHKKILFSDEKIFTIEQARNRQNDRL